jgi:hypothetical protein
MLFRDEIITIAARDEYITFLTSEIAEGAMSKVTDDVVIKLALLDWHQKERLCNEHPL